MEAAKIDELAYNKRYSGYIKVFYEDRRFGFIQSDGVKTDFGSDAFLSDKELGSFIVGSSVSFSIAANADGKPQARLLEAVTEGPNVIYRGNDGFVKVGDPEATTTSKDKRYFGFISAFYPERNFGFIKSDEVTVEFGCDAFLCGESGVIQPNAKISFKVRTDKKGRPQARYVELIEDPLATAAAAMAASAATTPQIQAAKSFGFSEAAPSGFSSGPPQPSSDLAVAGDDAGAKRRRRSGWDEPSAAAPQMPLGMPLLQQAQQAPPPPPLPPPVPAEDKEWPEDSPIGQGVEVQGLASRPEMNGKKGIIKDFDADTGRYLVSVDLGEGGWDIGRYFGEFRLKAANIKDSWYGTAIPDACYPLPPKEGAPPPPAAASSAALPGMPPAPADAPPPLPLSVFSAPPIPGLPQPPATPLAAAPIFTQPVVPGGSNLIGKAVEVQGLSARPEMNGMKGYVTAFDGELGRFCVDIEGGRGEFKLKPDNLKDLSAAQSLAQPDDAGQILKGTYSMGYNGMLMKICPISANDKKLLLADMAEGMSKIQTDTGCTCNIETPKDGLEIPLLMLTGALEQITMAENKIRTFLMIESQDILDDTEERNWHSSLDDKFERIWAKSGKAKPKDSEPNNQWSDKGWSEPKSSWKSGWDGSSSDGATPWGLARSMAG